MLTLVFIVQEATPKLTSILKATQQIHLTHLYITEQMQHIFT